MFGKSKDDSTEKDPAPAQEFQRVAIAHPAAPGSAEDISTVSSAMTIVGKITGEGTVKIYGRVEGELHATTILISDRAEVEGEIVADDLTIGGRVKGTIHANRVRLNGTAVVEGDIYHRSLAIEEPARFEGSSRREDAVIDAPRVPLGRASAQASTNVAATESKSKRNGAPDTGTYASPATE
jgi:cytoskeletal protein CcmA (bactofilin family)